MFVTTRRPYDLVAELTATGLSDYEVARRTGVPRSTVQRWRVAGGQGAARRPSWQSPWRPSEGRSYCYVLGLYLGDGHLGVRRGRPRFFRLSMDAAYPRVIDEAARALETVFEGSVARRYEWGDALRVVVQVCHGALLEAFPQHGPGVKHSRRIELADWQRDLSHAHPGALVRGLIHSDGCRTINRFKTVLPSGRTKE